MENSTPLFITIYELNFENGDKYIGYTKLSLKKRLFGHTKNFGKTFSIHEIEKINVSENPRKLIKYWESFWISQYKQFGFIHEVSLETRKKLSQSLKGNKNFLGKKHSSDTKQKMSINHKGVSFSEIHKNNLSEAKYCVKLSDNHKNNISLSHKNRPKNSYVSGMKNKQHSEETKLKISLANSGINNFNFEKPSKNRKPILQFDMNNNFIREWDYITLASIELSINRTCIISVCNYRQKSAGGYIWKYINNS